MTPPSLVYNMKIHFVFKNQQDNTQNLCSGKKASGEMVGVYLGGQKLKPDPSRVITKTLKMVCPASLCDACHLKGLKKRSSYQPYGL